MTADPDQSGQEDDPRSRTEDDRDSGQRDNTREETDRDWRFSLDDLSDSQEEGAGVAGELLQDDPVEPESINPENAFFFLVGSLGTVVFIALAIMGL